MTIWNKIEKMLSWHLRKDLSLRDRWWHRFSLLIYFFLTIFVFVALINSGNWKILDYPQYTMVNVVGDRIDSSLNTLAELTNHDERIENVGASSYSFKILKSEGLFNEEFSNNIYCSTKIQNHLDTILNNRKIEHFFVEGQKVLLENFINNIENNNVSCVFIDSYSNSFEELRRTSEPKLYFLRTDKDFFYEDGFSEGLGFYKVSEPKTLLFVVVDLIFVLLLILVSAYFISVIYHKVVLYIIFGKERKEVNKYEK